MTGGSAEGSFQPDVTVVIISYNDVANLGAAIRSVQQQTLSNLEIIVSDDHSSDSTPELVRSFIESDSRIKYHRLPQNSGGCGAPRNQARLLASAKYVMFLDSDDTLERHACKNLLLEAESNGSDIVSGKIQRVYLGEEKRITEWYPSLYQERVHFKSIEDYPEFIHDTAVTNKLYRREFLEKNDLVFLEDIHYEDMIYSAQCLSRAHGISIIPELIYNWNVYPSETRKSITNQRDEIKNLTDRLFSVSLAYDEFKRRAPKVLTEFQLKLLRHHFRLYLNDMVSLDTGWGQQVLETISPWLPEISAEVYGLLEPVERFLYASVLSGDVDSVKKLVPAAWARSISGVLVEEADGSYWVPKLSSERYSDSQLALLLTEATDIEKLTSFNTSVPVLHLGTLVADSIHGFTTDVHRLLIDNVKRMRLVEQPNPTERFYVSDIDFKHNGTEITWAVDVPQLKRQSFRERTGKTFFVEMLTEDRTVHLAPLALKGYDNDLRLKDHSLIGAVLGDQWEITSQHGRPAVFELLLSRRGELARSMARYIWSAISKPKQLLKKSVKYFSSQSYFGRKIAYPLMRCLPVKKRLFFFESNMGSTAFDNPRAIYDELVDRNENFEAIWAHNGKHVVIADLPTSKKVQRDSYGYLWALARASHIVENQSLPRYFVKRKTQKYLQTWHGIPFKKMGIDEPRFNTQSAQKYLKTQSSKWDALLSPSEYFEKTFVPAFLYDNKVIKSGSPRLDNLVNGRYVRSNILDKLRVPRENRVILYAPTFREDSLQNREADLLFDIEQFVQKVPSNTTLLVRAHYLNRFVIPDSVKDFCKDVSSFGNVTELYAASDLLITDYSSVMFDFAVTGKPIVIYAPDYNEYVREARGAYFNLRDNAPGEFIDLEEDLYAYLSSNDAFSPQINKLKTFQEKFVGEESGNAASMAVDFLLGIKDDKRAS